MLVERKDPVKNILEKYQTLIVDGALATELEGYGCDLNDPLWSARVLIENPELIYKVHKEYFLAGADCAITASYQATIDGFKQRGIQEEEGIKLIKKTVELAKQARDDFWEEHKSNGRPKPIVAASVGPYGAYLADGSEYVGNYGVDDEILRAFHEARIKALIEAEADVLAFETIPSLQEAKVLSGLLEKFQPAYAWLSFSLKNEKEISDGSALKVCAEAFKEHPQIVAVGVNCSATSVVTEAIRTLHHYSSKPVIVYPNSGEAYDAETKTWHGSSTGKGFHEESKDWYEAGARLIGGCCRTSPQHIKELAHTFRA